MPHIYAESSLPEYRCHKIVKGAQILDITIEPVGSTLSVRNEKDDSTLEISVDEQYMEKHKPYVGGYYVLYRDGYESFSPQREFSDGYTLIVIPQAEDPSSEPHEPEINTQCNT